MDSLFSQIANGLLHFLNVSGDFDFGKDPRHSTGSIDDHGGALDSPELESVHGFLLPDSECVSEPMALVREKSVRELVLLPEFAV
jgi:hypothetical protein